MQLLRSQAKSLMQAAYGEGLGPHAEFVMGFALACLTPTVFFKNWRARSSGGADGLPIPPDHLIYLVTGSRNVEHFLASGARSAAAIYKTLGEAGKRIDEFENVLDFGCGCGRILRHLVKHQNVRLHGSDYNGQLAKWTGANLPNVDVRKNEPLPPLPFDAQSFDFIYSFSVFTHLSAESQVAWITELERVLRPGGLLLITVHGEAYRGRLDPAEQRRFDAGQLVTRYDGIECTNLCAAFHPHEYVNTVFGAHFEKVFYLQEASKGTGSQDSYLFQKAAQIDSNGTGNSIHRNLQRPPGAGTGQ